MFSFLCGCAVCGVAGGGPLQFLLYSLHPTKDNMASPKFSANRKLFCIKYVNVGCVFRETERDCTVANRNMNYNSQNLGKRKRNSVPVR